MRTKVTHVIAPLRWADYIRSGDTRYVSRSDMDSCDRLLAYEEVGEVCDIDPLARHMHTRNDPPLARYSFLLVEDPPSRH